MNRCTDPDIERYDKEVQKFAGNLQKAFEDAKSSTGDTTIADVAGDLAMTGKAKKVFQIIMDALREHFSDDQEIYYELAAKITKSLRKKY